MMEGEAAAAPGAQPPAEGPPAAAALPPAEHASAHQAGAAPAAPAAQPGREGNGEATGSAEATPAVPGPAGREGDGATLLSEESREHLDQLDPPNEKQDHAAVELLKWTASFAVAFGAREPHAPPRRRRAACRATADGSSTVLLRGQAPLT